MLRLAVADHRPGSRRAGTSAHRAEVNLGTVVDLVREVWRQLTSLLHRARHSAERVPADRAVYCLPARLVDRVVPALNTGGAFQPLTVANPPAPQSYQRSDEWPILDVGIDILVLGELDNAPAPARGHFYELPVAVDPVLSGASA